jgi:pimeloyl-ACP methyl ester carboxylesterase
MPNILANDIRIYYEERGSGPAMVWAHGLAGTWQGWEKVMDFFQNRFRVIAYDARGHGRSEIPDQPEAYSQDIMVEDMRGFLDALGITNAIVGGHSMGANVALNCAIKYPKRCLGVIPVGIGSGSSNAEWWQEWWGKLADLAEKKGMAAFLEEMKKLPAWGSALADPKMGKDIRQTVLANSLKGIAYTVRGVQIKRPSIFSLQSKLEKLAVPTLVVLSEGDTPVVESSRFMAEHIPGAVLEIIPAKSHWTFTEAPEKFCQVVDRFVTRFISERRAS